MSTPQLTLLQLYHLTPKTVKKRASGLSVQAHSAALGVSRTMHRLDAVYKVRSASAPGAIYKVVIRQYASKADKLISGRLHRHNPTWMHCSCDWYKFVCEVANTWYQCSSVIRSNGQPPLNTNPNMIPMMCKHLVAVAALNPNLNAVSEKFSTTDKVPATKNLHKKASTESVSLVGGKQILTSSQQKAEKLDKELDDLL